MANEFVLFPLIASWKTATALCYFPFVITRRLLVLAVHRAMPRAISDGMESSSLSFWVFPFLPYSLCPPRSVLILQILIMLATLLAEMKSLE